MHHVVTLIHQVTVLKLLKHPNIVAHYDNFVADKSLVIVMEYAPGGTLHEFIQDRNETLMEEDVSICSSVYISVCVQGLFYVGGRG